MSGPDPPFDWLGYLPLIRRVPWVVWFGLVLSSLYLILINFYVTGFMVLHPLVVISLNKILPSLKANAVESPTLEPHSLCYTC